MKVVVVFGTRPEIIKVEPVIAELENRGIETILIHTGQHNLDSLIKDFKLKKPDYVLDIPPESAGKFRGGLIRGAKRAFFWSMTMRKNIRDILKKEKPDVLLYQGDTLAIAAASLAGRFIKNRPILGHIEAGLRTYKLLTPFPEEISRIVADKTSDLLFTPTKIATNNLKKEKFISGEIIETGNTIVDAVLRHRKMVKKTKTSKKYGIVFVHRQENVHNKEKLDNLYNLMSNLEEELIFIEHPTLMEKLKDYNMLNKFKQLKHVHFKPFYDYLPFIGVLDNAEYIVTDSGGIQEEVSILKTPCLVWRTSSERMESVKAGCAFIVGSDYKKCLEYIEDFKNKGDFYQKVKKAKNPFGDGHTAKRIVDVLEKRCKNV